MKVIAIVQARMGSSRLPNKVMKPIGNVPLIELLLERLSKANKIDKIILATSDAPNNTILVEHVEKLGYEVYKGSESNVLDRYYQIANLHTADAIVRITGDCPLVDPEMVDEAISSYEKYDVDYVSNASPPTFPDGLDIEVFSHAALTNAWENANSIHDKEHVTPYIESSGDFRIHNIECTQDLSDERWTVDEPEDFELIESIFNYFYPRRDFGWEEVLKLKHERPEWFIVNQHLIRNEGAQLGKGQKLWKRAKKVIPGGNMLLSKRSEMFLPEKWPSYFSKAKGCHVWDMDGRKYIDMCIMGIGTNILGYGQSEVDEAVHNIVTSGNMSTLNCPEEVYLAERLVELHPWSDMVRLARTGGEANSIAIRIARAASGKNKVAFCGYHGWHDWYLAANLGDDKNLEEHLLPGLNPKGVPTDLRNTIYPFTYNRFDELEAIVRQQDIGVIKMEVCRSEQPHDNFLQKVRQLATEKNIVLIFDECTSGFRQSFGGLHKVYDVEPDMAVFGKALGNGYAITAIIGRKEVMQSAQSTFISSTFWTERIGPTAALKTLEVMERTKSWSIITETGNKLAQAWKAMAKKHDLQIKINGLPALIGFSIQSSNGLAYKTLITQEMLKRGYLAATSVYVCTEHTPDIVKGYLDELDSIFELINKCENGLDVNSLLEGPVCHDGFKRLN